MGYCYFIATSGNKTRISLHFLALAQTLAQRGHRVVVLLSHAGPEVESADSNPAIYAWPSPRPTRLQDGVFLRRLVKKYQPQCLIGNFGAVNVMMLVGWLMRVPCRIAWYHTLSAAIVIDSPLPRWKDTYQTLRKRFVYKLATHLVAVSQAAAEDIQRVFKVSKDKCSVANYTISDPRAELALPEVPWQERDKIVCVGRLHPCKGQDNLIRAAGLLKTEYPRLQLEFVGDGPNRDAYTELARTLEVTGNCSFTGNMPLQQVFHKMNSAFVTVVPSRSDASPLVLFESLAVGTSVIGSQVGGIPEVIRDGIDGFLVPVDDPAALAEKLRILLLDPALCARMGQNARGRFLAEFEQGKALPALAARLEKLVSTGTA